jgi:hypothetical protein
LPFNSSELHGRLPVPTPIDRSYWPFDYTFHAWQGSIGCTLDEVGIDMEGNAWMRIELQLKAAQGSNLQMYRYIFL